MRLSEDEFWSLTPRQYSYVDRRWRQERERQEFHFGQLASVIANYSFCHPKRMLVPADFMPSQCGKTRPLPSDDDSAAAIDAALMPISIRVN